jgi:hypothetical protein
LSDLKDDSGCGVFVGMAILCVVVGTAAALNGYKAGMLTMETEAVEQGVAHYDHKTKEFKWDPPSRK